MYKVQTFTLDENGEQGLLTSLRIGRETYKKLRTVPFAQLSLLFGAHPAVLKFEHPVPGKEIPDFLATRFVIDRSVLGDLLSLLGAFPNPVVRPEHAVIAVPEFMPFNQIEFMKACLSMFFYGLMLEHRGIKDEELPK